MKKHYKIAFLGTGSMATSIIKALLRERYFTPTQVIATHYKSDKIRKLRKILPIDIISSNIEAVKLSEIIFLCVRPQQIGELLEEIRDYCTDDKIIVSIAAGVPLEKIRQRISHKPKNIFHLHPASLAFSSKKIGVSFLSPYSGAQPEQTKIVKHIATAFGEVEILKESDLNKYIVMAGCVPGYLSLVVLYLSEIGKELGIKPRRSLELEKKMLVGVRSAIVEENYEPQQIIRLIATKGGVTQEGLNTFEKENLKAIIKKAVLSSLKKLEELKNCISNNSEAQGVSDE